MTANLVKSIKEAGQDFEWYPTTTEMLECVKQNMKFHFSGYGNTEHSVNVLDCGAGDGRALKFLSGHGNMYAIEKSKILIHNMDSEIFIVGTDFEQSTLIDKKVDAVFCNPPYSQYEAWATKVIAESNASMVYLIIPERWKNSAGIEDAITKRKGTAKVLGSFDFLSADRKARAKVDIIAIQIYTKRGYGDQEPTIDPFAIWFDSQFDFDKAPEASFNKENFKTTVKNALVTGGGVIPTLVTLYDADMATLWENYNAVSRLDYGILYELGVDIKMLKGSLKEKIVGLKNRYWNELFDNFAAITSRLSVASRKTMIDTMLKNTVVDFTESNAYAVTVWAIKNANKYYDKQLVDLVEGMIGAANITLYKSNMRTFGKEDWRWCHAPEGLDRYALELRIVLHNKGGTGTSGYSWDYTNGLAKRAHDFLSDICTIANNLGFSCDDSSEAFEWSSGKKNEFMTSEDVLMMVKGFNNGNMHIKFNQKFIKKLNVEFGRLKGWLKNKEQAADELNIPIKEIEACFDSNFQLAASDVPLLAA